MDSTTYYTICSLILIFFKLLYLNSRLCHYTQNYTALYSVHCPLSNLTVHCSALHGRPQYFFTFHFSVCTELSPLFTTQTLNFLPATLAVSLLSTIFQCSGQCSVVQQCSSVQWRVAVKCSVVQCSSAGQCSLRISCNLVLSVEDVGGTGRYTSVHTTQYYTLHSTAHEIEFDLKN